MTGNGLADTLLLVAAILGGVVTIAGSGWKIWKGIDRVEDVWQVVSEIAIQFKPNHGTSLHDRVTKTEEQLATNTLVLQQIQKDIESVLIERPRSPNVIRAEVDEIDGTPI